MTIDSCWLIAGLLLTLGYLGWTWRQHPPLLAHSPALPTKVQRLLKPRTPDDCPACRQQPAPRSSIAPAGPPIRPWRECKSRRGAPKRIQTDGFACPTPRCVYYRIMDAQVHALVGAGTHGTHERIQTFRCQACRTTFSARRQTPLYRLKTASMV